MHAIVKDGEERSLLEVVRLKRRLRQCQNHGLLLTVAPTLACDFSCSYCYVSRQADSSMDDATEDALIRFIDKWPGSREILSIDWFGGEPLLAFDRIQSVTRKLLDGGHPLTASISTNGYHLDQSVIGALGALRIASVHIPLDGDKCSHNASRGLQPGKAPKPKKAGTQDEETYDRIIQNIQALLASDWKGTCTIRVNLDKSNLRDYPALYQDLRERIPQKNLHIYPGILDASHRPSCSRQTPDDTEVAALILEMYRGHGSNPRRYFAPTDPSHYCSFTQPNSLVVAPSGKLYKCWCDLGKAALSVGNIFDQGKMTLGEASTMARYMVGVDPFDDPICADCVLLPNCFGGCPNSRVRAKYHGHDVSYCPFMKADLPGFLEVYYENKKSQRL
ncbi:radical SAM/SPASM domain-containing protein [Thiorhodovibrio frisius]|nr:SPASM domain-containing protein [Thiorhodovibrio frisius]